MGKREDDQQLSGKWPTPGKIIDISITLLVCIIFFYLYYYLFEKFADATYLPFLKEYAQSQMVLMQIFLMLKVLEQNKVQSCVVENNYKWERKPIELAFDTV